mmetsp:Transcript_26288/g.34542  ORF Transcript_26288/g.34542 Transcript_26288/m.34542 type:complete len:132 (-) Transcript_26288:424-819(-)
MAQCTLVKELLKSYVQLLDFSSKRTCCPSISSKLSKKRMAEGDPNAKLIYESIGVYLGYALAQYSEFYEIDHVLILGRVTSGDGGQIILDKAKEVLESEFPDLDLSYHTPNEHMKRVGQCVAAAALPKISV